MTIVSVDPSVIPLGSRLTIRKANGGTFNAIAADTGGAIRGNRLDVLMPTRQSALEFGRKDVKVTVINRKGSD
jgi:3D (Asp-Asp-Asp) domain-containing protein